MTTDNDTTDTIEKSIAAFFFAALFMYYWWQIWMDNYTESSVSTIDQIPSVPFNVCMSVVIVSIVYATCITLFVMLISTLLIRETGKDLFAASAFFILYVFNDIINILIAVFVCHVALSFYVKLFVDKLALAKDKNATKVTCLVLLVSGLCIFGGTLVVLHTCVNE
jgi:hypothetical protein